MVNKKNWLGILAMMLVFGFFFNGCDNEELSGEYTIEFKIGFESPAGLGGGLLNEIQFINGSNQNAPILETKTVNLAHGELSSTYTISGFTEKSEDDERYIGIKFICINGRNYFDYRSLKNKSKIKVIYNDTGFTNISNGNW